MRVAFIGASHWHLPLYLEPLLDISDARVVGVSDPDPHVVEALQARLQCAGATDYAALCAQAKPDFVIALGRHADMAAQARYLIDQRIPFALEKPCGLNVREVEDIAERAAAAGAFAAVPLVFRNGNFAAMLRKEAEAGGVQQMSVRFIAGSPQRYIDAGCAWMLDPATSGGGCTINLAPHFVDLCLGLLGPDVRVAHATMSNAAWGYPIEDYSALMLEQGGRHCLIETGYMYPGPTSTFDMHFAIRTPHRYIIVPDPQGVDLLEPDGTRRTTSCSTTNVPHYETFVRDVLRRVSTGQKPLADLHDMVPIIQLIEEAYRLAGKLPMRR